MSELIKYAIEQKADKNTLQKVMEYVQGVEANKAKYLDALSTFQFDVGIIDKTGRGQIDGKEHLFLSMEDIEKAIAEPALKNGFSKRFSISETEKVIEVACIIGHNSGHEDVCTMSGLKFTSNDSVVNVKANAGMVALLRRYTMTSALGLIGADREPGNVSFDVVGFAEFDEYFPSWRMQVEGGESVESILAYLENAGIILSDEQTEELKALEAGEKADDE